jgi:hypothetical protein
MPFIENLHAQVRLFLLKCGILGPFLTFAVAFGALDLADDRTLAENNGGTGPLYKVNSRQEPTWISFILI